MQASEPLLEDTRVDLSHKRFQFGHQVIATYTKHDRQPIKHVFWNPNSKAYVSFQDRALHVWSPVTQTTLHSTTFSDVTKFTTLSWVTYSPKNMVSQ